MLLLQISGRLLGCPPAALSVDASCRPPRLGSLSVLLLVYILFYVMPSSLSFISLENISEWIPGRANLSTFTSSRFLPLAIPNPSICSLLTAPIHSRLILNQVGERTLLTPGSRKADTRSRVPQSSYVKSVRCDVHPSIPRPPPTDPCIIPPRSAPAFHPTFHPIGTFDLPRQAKGMPKEGVSYQTLSFPRNAPVSYPPAAKGFAQPPHGLLYR